MHGAHRTIQPKEARGSWRCRRLPRGRHTGKPALVHLEELDVVRVVHLRTAERLYAGTEGVRRAPRLGDQGIVVMTCPIGNANEAVTVKCVSPDGALTWLADFAVDELELTQDTLERRRQRSLRRARRWVLVAVALAGGSTGFTFLRDRLAADILLYLALLLALALFVVSIADLGRAQGSQPGATSADQELGVLLRAPRILVGISGVAAGLAALYMLVSGMLIWDSPRNLILILAITVFFLGGGAYLLMQPRRARSRNT